MSSSDWSCAACTFLNPQSKDKCTMCGTPRPAAGDQWSCAACTFLNPTSVDKCIICATAKPKEEASEKKQSQDQRDLPTIKAIISQLLFNEKRADVHFLIGRPDEGEEQQRIPAHKAVLAARSEVFSKLLFGPFQEARTKEDIVIDDIDPRAFRALIEAIYTDEVLLDDSLILGALYCAAKYECAALLKHCNDFVKQQCSVGNACGVFQNLPTAFAAQTSALGFIEDNCYDVIKTAGWKKLSLDKMDLILRSDRLMISEVDLFNAVHKWAQDKEDAKEGKLRDFLEPLLPHFRFPTLSSQDFANFVSPTKLLTMEQELFCFLNAASQEESDDGPVPPPPQDQKKLFDPSQFVERQGRGWRINYDEGKNELLQEGIFYWLGTRRSTVPWTNPADLRDDRGQPVLVCSASSISNGTPNTITARAHENGYSRSAADQWIQVELKGITVAPTHYQWRNRLPASGAAMVLRNWRFEGSNDGKSWTTLSRHDNDQTMPDQGGLTRGWRIDQSVKNRFFRFFRLFQHGNNAYGNGQLNYGNIEIFGSVRAAKE